MIYILGFAMSIDYYRTVRRTTADKVNRRKVKSAQRLEGADSRERLAKVPTTDRVKRQLHYHPQPGRFQCWPHGEHHLNRRRRKLRVGYMIPAFVTNASCRTKQT